MKKQLWILLSTVIGLSSFAALAEDGRGSSPTTHFQWKLPSLDRVELMGDKSRFEIKQGLFSVVGPEPLKSYGEKLVEFLAKSERKLAAAYGLQPGTREIVVSLFPLGSAGGYDLDFSVASADTTQLVLPYPVEKGAAEAELSGSFALFSLLQVTIKANLAFGSENRHPISSHAFRFVDGLSGFLALKIMQELHGVDAEKYLRILELQHLKRETARRYSSAQLLSQNASSEQTDILAGLSQFFSGISLTRDSEGATRLMDSSSGADRIRVFRLIQSRHDREGIRRIVGYLSRSEEIWTIQEKSEDSFCARYIGIGCREKTIDGTRADIVLLYSTGASFAELLQEVKKKREATEFPKTETLPAYPIYGFDFPKVGGANESVVDLFLYHDKTRVKADDICDGEEVAVNGLHFSLGIRDEAYRIQLQLDYSSGEKEIDDTFVFDGNEFTASETIRHTDLQIGSRIIERGEHTGWLTELGVYFHWQRFQFEWDTSRLSSRKTDREYINRGYFLLDIQNYKARKVAQMLALGLNYDFQVGLVSQSGSVLVARDEKYNTDFANLVLGANLGPELRLQLPSILLDVRLGMVYNYLWQPMDDEGGKTTGDNTVNASQSVSKIFATLGLSF
ncbi:MAG: hypothetical protein GY866_01535 [Proteobacteria bacterium]|nr:hypothetical protein [Pseudomonadota bacterium]